MSVFIDTDYKCHISSGDGLREFAVPFFDGKCAEFIEGYRYVPDGEVWMRSDGEAFQGEMIAPWKDYTQLYIAQLSAELDDADAALAELGVSLDG